MSDISYLPPAPQPKPTNRDVIIAAKILIRAIEAEGDAKISLEVAQEDVDRAIRNFCGKVREAGHGDQLHKLPVSDEGREETRQLARLVVFFEEDQQP